MTEEMTPETPSPLNTAREMLAGFDTLGMPLALFKSATKKPDYTGQYPVIVLPGFATHDVSTAPLRYFLTRNGFETMGWGLGFNSGGKGLIESVDELSDHWDVDRTRPMNGEFEVPALIDKMRGHVEELAKSRKTKFHIVGWSLGGFIAREVARDLPDTIVSITTLGSPVRGGPKYTSTAPLFKLRKQDLDWIEEEIEKRYVNPIKQPITAIYSKRDGVVGWKAMIDNKSPDVEHIEVNVSHMGLGLNAKVWSLVLDALKAHDKPSS